MTTLVIPPREGKAVSLGGFGAIFKISGESSEGRFSIVEHPIDPGRMVHPHVHAHEVEFSYILEGGLKLRMDRVPELCAKFKLKLVGESGSALQRSPIVSAEMMRLMDGNADVIRPTAGVRR